MYAISYQAFSDELEKIARVPTAVKQYRRAAEGWAKALRSIRTNPETIAATDLPSRGFALHGTPHLAPIVEGTEIGKLIRAKGKAFEDVVNRGKWRERLRIPKEEVYGDEAVRFLRPSPAGDLQKAQYGPGVYWWKGVPQVDQYLGGLTNEGIATNLRTLPGKLPVSKNIRTGDVAPWTQVTGPGPYFLNTRRNEDITKLRELAGMSPAARSDAAQQLVNEAKELATNDRTKAIQKLREARALQPREETKSVREMLQGSKPTPGPDAPAKEIMRAAKPGTIHEPDTAIIDMATRARNKTLGNVEADTAEAGLRRMDTAMYHRARRRMQSLHEGGKAVEPVKRPTKGELIAAYRQRLQGNLQQS